MSEFGILSGFVVRSSDFIRSLSPHRAENQIEFLGFAPKPSGFTRQALFSSGNHPQEKHRLFGFLPARANLVLEVLAGNSVVGLTVVRADTGSGADQLINQPVILRMADPARNLLGKADDRFPKTSGALHQIGRGRLFARRSLPKRKNSSAWLVPPRPEPCIVVRVR